MMTSIIIWAGIFIFLNCLDVITTYAGMSGYSLEEMQKKELNPFVSKIIQNRFLTSGMKLFMVGRLLVVLLVFYRGYAISLLQFLSIAIALVVLNNIHATWAEKHQRMSLGKVFIERLHIPKTITYFLLTSLVSLLSLVVMVIGYQITGS